MSKVEEEEGPFALTHPVAPLHSKQRDLQEVLL